MSFTHKKLMEKYHSARSCALERNIEWHFTFDTWIEWWGEDIFKRGSKRGQLVMARYGDVGPYHPDNVRKATKLENDREAHLGKKKIFKNGISPLCKQIKTPLGIFESRNAAGNAHGVVGEAIRYRMKIKPTEYYYIKETI